MIDSSARDYDLMNKQKGKERADSKRRAKESDVMVGDKVLLRNIIFPSKLTPSFDKTTYEVVERNGSEVTVVGGGRSYKRNISMVKKILDDLSIGNEATGIHNDKVSSQVVNESSSPIDDLVSSPVDEQLPPLISDPPVELPNQNSSNKDGASSGSHQRTSCPHQEPLKLKLKKVEGMWQH